MPFSAWTFAWEGGRGGVLLLPPPMPFSDTETHSQGIYLHNFGGLLKMAWGKAGANSFLPDSRSDFYNDILVAMCRENKQGAGNPQSFSEQTYTLIPNLPRTVFVLETPRGQAFFATILMQGPGTQGPICRRIRQGGQERSVVSAVCVISWRQGVLQLVCRGGPAPWLLQALSRGVLLPRGVGEWPV